MLIIIIKTHTQCKIFESTDNKEKSIRNLKIKKNSCHGNLITFVYKQFSRSRSEK